ncbi:MAG: SBBP repeat-containing protein, partial [Promethearchaeota archaeon]
MVVGVKNKEALERILKELERMKAFSQSKTGGQMRVVKIYYRNIFVFTGLLIFSLLLFPTFSGIQEIGQPTTTQSRDQSLANDLVILNELLSNAPPDLKTDILANNRLKEGIIDSPVDCDPHPALYSFFRENNGQVPDYIEYYAQLSNGLVGFGLSKIYFVIDNNSFELEFLGAIDVPPTGVQPLPSYSNYFLGNQVFARVSHYAQIVYPELYEGITLTYQQTPQGLKYEFYIAPFADISQIQMMYSGVEDIHVDPSQMTLQLGSSRFYDDGLAVWYADTHQPIESTFEYFPSINSSFDSSKVIQFALDNHYDPSRAIIIDPLLLNISTFLGGSNSDGCYSLALDSANNVYLTGNTYSSDFSTTPGAYDTTHNGEFDVFVCKLSADGASLLYSTFIGGSYRDLGYSLALDSANNVYLTGYTSSSDFSTTPGAYDTTHNGKDDVFVCKLSADGASLLYSTFIGGSGDDYGHSLALDSANNVYLTGHTYSSDFPATPGAYNTTNGGQCDVFVCKLSADGASLLYSTFIGGNYHDLGYSLALDSTDNAYFAGYTSSSDFPTTPGAYDITNNGGRDVFVCKLSADGASLLYSTFIGGSGDDYGHSLALDSANNVYLTGYTHHSYSSDFPTTPGAYDITHNGQDDVFVCKLSADGASLLYSTFIGGSYRDFGYSLALDNVNNVCILGTTEYHSYSDNFPTTPDAYDSTHNGEFDVFVCKLSTDGTSLLHSTFIGGYWNDFGRSLALDSTNNAYFAGHTSSDDFPTTPGAYATTSSGSDVFVCKILSNPTVTLVSPTYGTYPQNSVNLIYSISSWTSIETVTIYLDGVANDTALPSGSVLFSLVDGTYNLTLVVIDGVGNLRKSTVIFMILKDSDLDGMPDAWETSNALNLTLDDASKDPDADGLTNLEEYKVKTDPHNSDTDADWMPDGWEVFYGLNPRLNDASEDPDADGLTNLMEYELGTSPLTSDTDADWMPDAWELSVELDPTLDDASEDPDADGLTNLEEYELGTSPHNSDTDADGMPDGWEVTNSLNSTDPMDGSLDYDNDGVSNFLEYQGGSNPRDFWSVPLFSLSILHWVVGVVLAILGLISLAFQIYKRQEIHKQGVPDYATLKQIKRGGFPDYKSYVRITKEGYRTFKEWEWAQKVQALTYEEFNAIKKGDFRSRSEWLAATELGYKNAWEWKDAKVMGAQTLTEYQTIVNGGFRTREEWQKAVQAGFKTRRQWLQARNLGIMSKREFEKYKSAYPALQPVSPTPLSIGSAFTHGLWMVQRQPQILLIAASGAVAEILLTLAIAALWLIGSRYPYPSADPILFLAVLIISFVIGSIITSWTLTTFKQMRERGAKSSIDIKASFTDSVSYLPSILGANLLVGIITFLVTLILGVPLYIVVFIMVYEPLSLVEFLVDLILLVLIDLGLLVLLNYVSQSVVLDEKGVLPSLSRSWQFARKYFWPTIGMVIVFLVIDFVTDVFSNLLPDLLYLVIVPFIVQFILLYSTVCFAWVYDEFKHTIDKEPMFRHHYPKTVDDQIERKGAAGKVQDWKLGSPSPPTSTTPKEDLTLIKTTILQQGQEKEAQTGDGTPIKVLFHSDYLRHLYLPSWT